MANLVRDVKILQESRAAAFETLERDVALTREENKMLRAELVRAHGGAALISVG